jgi:hypothetical protein
MRNCVPSSSSAPNLQFPSGNQVFEKGGEICVFNGIGGGLRAAENGDGRDWLTWEARLVRIKSQIYLAAPKATGRRGDGATGGWATKKIFFRPTSPSPVAPSPRRPSLLGRTYRGLRGSAGLSHCESARQIFNQIIDIFDADRDTYEIGRRRESVPQRLWDTGVRHPAGQADG